MTRISWMLAALVGCAEEPVDIAGDTAAAPSVSPTEAVAEACADQPCLDVSLTVDPEQERLDNLGQPATVPEGHAAQSPRFQRLAISYLELSTDPLTPLGGGWIVWQAGHQDFDGQEAVDFDALPLVEPGQTAVAVPLEKAVPGEYRYLRMALSYQEYDVDLEVDVMDAPVALSARLLSFVEDASYIRELDVLGETVEVYDVKEQGFWVSKGDCSVCPVEQGQAPVTTVVNPLFETSPVPPGSCVVTNAIEEPLVITGDEGADVELEVSLSTNDSFEWQDDDGDGVWQPLDGEIVVDMGVRGIQIRQL